ncbi:MAG: polyprenol monophosphomannose synthase [Chloroflexi bacterium]|nr:polyprenol monophosphomannose synthase [Chloroflexota bacterium]
MDTLRGGGCKAVNALVVLPTYNESRNLREIVPAILQAAPVSVLIVDDNSPDGTGQIAEELRADFAPRIDVLHRPGKAGLGRAYVAGFRYALEREYDFVFEMDADFSHDPTDLPRFLEAIKQADLVVGSRYVPGGGTVNWPIWRRLISRGGSLYARAVLGASVHDLTGGFKCFRREALAVLDLESVQSNGYSFQIEVTYRLAQLGFRITEIPIKFVERREGVSKMSWRIVAEAMLVVWRLRLGRRAAAVSGRPSTVHPE